MYKVIQEMLTLEFEIYKITRKTCHLKVLHNLTDDVSNTQIHEKYK